MQNGGSMWFSKAMNDALNAQIGMEFRASQQYVMIATYFDREGLPVLAKRFYRQAVEERSHAMRLVKYVMDGDGNLRLPAIPAMDGNFPSSEAAALKALEGEREVTAAINALMDQCNAEKDHLTYNFLQWFVAEQREELASAETFVKMVQRTGESGLIQVESYLSQHSSHGSEETAEEDEAT
jgi:bacterioferritin B